MSQWIFNGYLSKDILVTDFIFDIRIFLIGYKVFDHARYLVHFLQNYNTC